jgi:hypothetical protein
MLGRRHDRARATTVAVATALAALTLVRYRGALATFFFLDDFWILHDAAEVGRESSAIGAIAAVFRPGHAGFGLYRPLTSVGYSFLLQTFFGYDASAHHAVQLLVFAGVVVLAFAIAYRLTGSTVAATAASLMHLTAPGQAVDAYWLAAFEVTGTAFVLLLTMWCWLSTAGRRRVVTCTILQVLGLLASEHAVAGPALLATLAAMRREPWRRAAADIAPSAVVVAVYLIAKLYYFLYLRTFAGQMTLWTYGLTPDVRIWVQHLGQYLVACFTPLTLWSPGEGACLALGAALAAVFALGTWRAYRSDGPWDLIAGGIALFAAALGPVLFQRARVGSPYVCVAALGAALAVVGGCGLAGRHGRALALAVALAMLLLDERTAERAWRQSDLFRLVTFGGDLAADWMATIPHGAGGPAADVEALVPADPTTTMLFKVGQVQTFFPGIPRRVTLYDPHNPPVPKAGQVVLDKPIVIDSPGAFPGAERRWNWLRRLAGVRS